MSALGALKPFVVGLPGQARPSMACPMSSRRNYCAGASCRFKDGWTLSNVVVCIIPRL